MLSQNWPRRCAPSRKYQCKTQGSRPRRAPELFQREEGEDLRALEGQHLQADAEIGLDRGRIAFQGPSLTMAEV